MEAAANQAGATRPSSAGAPPGYVAEADYFLALLAERNIRLDSEIRAVTALLNTTNSSFATMLGNLKESIGKQLDELDLRHQQRLVETDSRIRQRFEELDLRYHQQFDHLRTKFGESARAAEKSVSVALESAEKAVTKAEMANEKRFDSVNEFRAQLRDQASTFIPRPEAEQRMSQLSGRLEELRDNDALRTGRSAGSAALYGWIVGGIAALATMIIVAATLLK